MSRKTPSAPKGVISPASARTSGKLKATPVKPDGKPALLPKLRFPEFRNAEGWEEKSLAQICHRITNGKANAQDHEEAGVYPLFDRSAVIKRSNEFVFDGEAVILPGEGMRFVPKFFRGKFNLHQRAYALMDHQADARFVYHSLDYLQESLAKMAVKSTVLSLRLPIVENFVIGCPKPAEQQKIADFLCSMNELIAAQARKLDLLKIKKVALMQQMFPREGETQPRLRFPEFENAGEWTVKRFDELLDDIIDFRGRTPLKLGMDWGGGNITSLSANNVKNGYIDYAAECNLGSEELYQRWMGDVNLEKDDIVFTMEAPLGKALLLPDLQKYILSQRVVAFKTKAEVRNPFLVQLIWNDSFQNVINELATGSTAKGINQKALKTIPVKLPHPKEQQRIADCLTSIDDIIAAQTQKLDALRAQKKGLMQQLFPTMDEVKV